jgi:hypothetical protein
MGSKSRLWCDRCIVTRAPGSRGNSYFTGGRSGLSAHLRAVGSCSGSSAQLVQTYRSFRSPISSRTAFIGLPQAGHAFRTGSDTGIWFSPAMAVYVRRHRDLKTVAESCMGLPTLLDSKAAGYSTRGSDCVGGRDGAPKRPIRPPDVVCWVSPCGTTPREALGRSGAVDGGCRSRAPRPLPSSPDRAGPDQAFDSGPLRRNPISA